MRSTSIRYYRQLFRSVEILPDWGLRVRSVLERIRGQQDRYERALKPFGDLPWEMLALVHALEADCDPDRQVLNGERWDETTTRTPEGYGPWPSWEAAAADAIVRNKWHRRSAWSPAWILKRLEQFNGLGYAQRGVHSPYLWSGTQHGVRTGKFVADGVYDANAVSEQVGAGALLWAMRAWGEPSDPRYSPVLPIQFDLEGEAIRPEIVAYQVALNEMILSPVVESLRRVRFGAPLKVDGWAGRRTSEATWFITGNYLPGDRRRR